jgi:hypothetical protein
MATIRIDCTAEEYSGNWIEYRSAWTRGDTKRLDAATTEEDILDLIAGKVAKCHVTTAEGNVIDSPDGLTVEAIDDLDEVLAQWLIASVYQFIAAKRRLGNLSASVSSSTNGKVTIPTQTQATATNGAA